MAHTVDALIIAGGGDWGPREFENQISAAGGGAGDMVEVSGESVVVNNYTVTVGLASSSQGNNGGNSSALGYTAIGGGKGSNGSSTNGSNGGSGGAGGENASGGTAIGNGFGNNGGKGANPAGSNRASGGGGGGAGGAGQNGGVNGGDGGAARNNSITGTSRPYCAGGGGGRANGITSSVGATPASDYGRGGYAPGGTGWSKTAQDGVVIIRYLTGTIIATGGTITTSGEYTIHTFTSSGTFAVTALIVSQSSYAFFM